MTFPMRHVNGRERRFVQGHARIPGQFKWTKERRALLAEVFAKWDWDELLCVFPTTQAAIRKHANSTGLRRPETWSAVETAVLRGRWPDQAAIKAELPLRSIKSIAHKGKRLGLPMLPWGIKFEHWNRTGQRGKPNVIGEDFKRKLLENDIYAQLDRAVPRGLPKDVRDAVISDMFMAYLDGDLPAARFASGHKKFLTAHNREFGGYRDVSLDAVVPGTENLRRIDMLVDDSWRDEFDRLEEML